MVPPLIGTSWNPHPFGSFLKGFPEMKDGRVKNLHPLVHGGILGIRDNPSTRKRHGTLASMDRSSGMQPLSLARTIEHADVSLDEAMENIDIGGPSMIRSAAKNVGWVTVATDPTIIQSYWKSSAPPCNLVRNPQKAFCSRFPTHCRV